MKKKIKKILLEKKNQSIIIGIIIGLFFLLSLYLFKFKWTIIISLIILILYGSLYYSKYGGKIMAKKRKKTTKKGKGKTKRKKIKKVINWIGILSLGLGIFLLTSAGLFFLYIISVAPPFNPENLYRQEASIVYDVENNITSKIGREIREKVSYNKLPEILVDAIIATEDARFFQHNGFDFPRFLKAGFGEVTGHNAGGGSTLSMQVVKNSFTSGKRSYIRKFTDIYLTIFKLEKKYSKEEIIEFYVNIPFLGNNSYGVAEAAKNYFGKNLQDINLAEAAMLAGLFQAPSAYDPYIHPENTERRRNTVLYLMRRHGYITKEQEKIANSIPIESLLIEPTNKDNTPYQGYLDVVIKEAEEKTGYSPNNVPMKIYTNLTKDKQLFLNEVLNEGAFTFPNDVIQSGIVVTDIKSGAILAIGNGRNRKGKLLFNYVTELEKQIGSTAKPIFDYGPGMEYNNWSTYTPFLDDVHQYTGGNTIKNWDGSYHGLVTSRYALVYSRNIPALRAFQQVDNKNILEFVQKLRINPEIENGKVHEAHAIGAFDKTTPLQLTTAYAAFGNGGYYIEPHTINKIEFLDNNETITYQPLKERVMSDSTAYMITNILKYGVDINYIKGKIPGIEIAAKSGTTNFDADTIKKYGLSANALNDLWYVGYSPDYAIGMWLGYEKFDKNHYNTTASWSVRDNLFTTLSRGIFKDTKKKTFDIPSSVVRITVEKNTVPAMFPSEWTPDNMKLSEYFKKGTEPTEVSPKYKQLENPLGVDINLKGKKIELTWEPITPLNFVTNELIKTLAQHKNKYLTRFENERLKELGEIGYEVYLKSKDKLTLLGWTKKNSFTYEPTTSGDLTFVVKTCYSLFKNNRSSGSEITISDNPYIPLIEVSLMGEDTIYLEINNEYQEPGFLVMENHINVTSEATVTKTTTRKSDNQIILNNLIDTSKPETYTITYNIEYQGKTTSLTRTVIIE